MDKNARTEELFGSRNFPEHQQYFPDISPLRMCSQNQQTPLSYRPGTQSLYPSIVSTAKSRIPNNYSGTCTSELLPTFTVSSEVLAHRTGSTVCAESNAHSLINGSMENPSSCKPNYMPYCVSSASATHTIESSSQSQASNGNLKVQLLQSRPYMYTSGTGSSGQQTLQQQQHSVKDHGNYIAKQKGNTLPNGMQIVWVQPQNFNQPGFQQSSNKLASLRPINLNLKSQHNICLPNEQPKASSAHAAVMHTDVPHQITHNSFLTNPQYLHPPTNFTLQNTPISKQPKAIYILPKETNMHVSSQQQMVAFQNVHSRGNFANASVSDTSVPSQNSCSQALQHPNFVSNQNLNHHNNLTPSFTASSTTPPMQCQLARQRNDILQNQHFLRNDITSGNHSPNANVCQMKTSSYISQRNYSTSLQPENTVTSFSHSKTGLNSFNMAEVAISQSTYRNGNAIQTTKVVSGEQSPHTPTTGESRPACNPEINHCAREQVGQYVNATANNLGAEDAVITEEDMMKEVKILMHAKEYFLNSYNVFKEKRKLYESSTINTIKPINKPGPKLSNNLNSSYVSNVSPNVSCVATDHPSPPPCTAQTHASLLPITSEQLVTQKNQAQHTIVEQQWNFKDRSSNFSGQLLDNYCYPDSAAVASISPTAGDRETHISKFSEGKYLQPDKTLTANHDWMFENSAAMPDVLNTDTVDLQEKTNVNIEPIDFCQSNDQLKLVAQRVEKMAELQREKHNIIYNSQSSNLNPSLAQLSERNGKSLNFPGTYNTVETDPREQSRSSYSNKSERSSILTDLITEVIHNYSKPAETDPDFPNSSQQQFGVPLTNNDDVLINIVSQSCSNSIDSTSEIVSTYQHEPVKKMPKPLPTEAGLSNASEDIFNSCIDMLEIPTSNRLVQGKPMPNTNMDIPLLCTATCTENEKVQKNEQQTITMYKKNFPLNNPNGAHPSTVPGPKQDSLSLNVVKAVEPQVAIVNPLFLSNSKSPVADQQNKSEELESCPVVQEDTVCNFLADKTQCVIGGALQPAIPDIFSEATPSHLPNMNTGSCKSESDTTLTAGTDKCEIVTPSDYSDCQSVNENCVNQCLQTEKLTSHLESCQTPEPVGVLLHEHEKCNSLTPQTSLLSIESSFSRQDFSLDDSADCIKDASDEQLKISSFCTLVEGNSCYDSQIAEMFDNISFKQSESCLTSQENMVSEKTKELECNPLKHSVASDLVEQSLVDVDKSKHHSSNGQSHPTENCEETNEYSLVKSNEVVVECLLEDKTEQMQNCLDSGIVEKEPIDKNDTLNESQNPSNVDVSAMMESICSKEEQSTEHYALMHMESETLDLETILSNDELNQDEHFSDVSDTNNCFAIEEHYEGTSQKESPPFLNDQLSALQREFPYGFEPPESTDVPEKHLLPGKKDFDMKDCTVAGESPLNTNVFPLVDCDPNKDCSTSCVIEQNVSGNESVATKFSNNGSASSLDTCDPQQSSLIQGIPNCETPQGHVVQFDEESNIFPEDISDSEKDDCISNIKITVLDSEQMIKFFPEISSYSVTNTNTQCSQQQSQCDNTIKVKNRETQLDSNKQDLASPKGTDENCSSTNTKLFCCLFRWLSSDYNDVPKCSCVPIHEKDGIESSLGSNQTHFKEQLDNSTNVKYLQDELLADHIEASGVQTSLEQKGKKQQNSSATKDNVTRSKADCHTSPLEVQYKPLKNKLNQPLNKTKYWIKPKNQGKKRRRKHSTPNPDSGEAFIGLKCDVQPSEHPVPNADLCVNNSLPVRDHKPCKKDFVTEKKHNYLALKGKMKSGKLVLDTGCLKFSNTTSSRPAHVTLSMNDKPEEINTLNKKMKHIEDHSNIQNRKQLNSDAETCLFAGKRSANREMSKEKLLSAEPGPFQWATTASNVKVLYQSNHAESVVNRHTLKVQEYFQRRKPEHKKAAKKMSTRCQGANKNKINDPIKKRKSQNFKWKKRDFALENTLEFYMSPESLEDVEPNHQGIPQKSFILKSCSPAKVNTLYSAEPKDNRLSDKDIKKLDSNVLILNKEADIQKRTTIPGQAAKESSKNYLNRVAFKNTSTEKIHLRRLDFEWSSGKLVGTQKSQKALDSSASQNDVQKSKVLEFKLCPEEMFNCSATDESHESDIAVPDKEKSWIEGIRSRKEDWLKNIPLKKRKVDMTNFKDGGLIDATLFEKNTSPFEGATPQVLGSNAVFHAFKQLFLEKRKKIANSIPQS
ncbi:uncharacterized protein LOC144810444 isoform X2 [Lissotriton helveticus]